MTHTATEHPSAATKAFAAFTDAPDDAIVRVNVVAMLFSCHANTVWRMAREGRLPPPKKISGGITGWRAGDIRARLRAA